jgi:phosphopantothenoylcysteine decarboxylase/phosphopantothenate--cysteine ligase
MTEPKAIYQAAETLFSEQEAAVARLLSGKKLIVTAGPTREHLDPIRYFSNASSGRMGYAIAEAACRLGADVTLVSGPSALRPPQGVTVIRVDSALEMQQEVDRRFDAADAVIKAAAVADYRPVQVSSGKIKKKEESLTIELVRNPDILRALGERKKNQILIGFAAETDHLDTYAREKLKNKNLDLLVANKAGDGFGKETNRVTFYFADGRRQPFPEMPKERVAEKICRALSDLIGISERK